MTRLGATDLQTSTTMALPDWRSAARYVLGRSDVSEYTYLRLYTLSPPK